MDSNSDININIKGFHNSVTLPLPEGKKKLEITVHAMTKPSPGTDDVEGVFYPVYHFVEPDFGPLAPDFYQNPATFMVEISFSDQGTPFGIHNASSRTLLHLREDS